MSEEKRDNDTAKRYVVNGRGDLAMNYDIRRYIGTEVEFVKVCKSGLVQVRTHDSELVSFARRNLDPVTDLERGKAT